MRNPVFSLFNKPMIPFQGGDQYNTISYGKMAYFLVFDLTNASTLEYVKMIYTNMSNVYDRYYVMIRRFEKMGALVFGERAAVVAAVADVAVAVVAAMTAVAAVAVVAVVAVLAAMTAVAAMTAMIAVAAVAAHLVTEDCELVRQAENFANENMVQLWLTSAITGSNVKKLFIHTIHMVYNNTNLWKYDIEESGSETTES
ncbi:GTPase [Plasmodium cynomolgi strain B]|uniref:GTPase n=1 Tax=Plasmodium cynomolgi (strain B) TaxID=1120755 RepID=K6ULC1_PLACD|nr:GTPase [Plasmodium cynomolgi strain B]GAB67588.1 GTPase [Plasmodium cynomolgi strain B]